MESTLSKPKPLHRKIKGVLKAMKEETKSHITNLSFGSCIWSVWESICVRFSRVVLASSLLSLHKSLRQTRFRTDLICH